MTSPQTYFQQKCWTVLTFVAVAGEFATRYTEVVVRGEQFVTEARLAPLQKPRTKNQVLYQVVGT
jgi:hypothetical protein